MIDATVNTVLQGIFVLEAIRMYEAGLPYEKVIGELEAIKGTGRIFFTVGNIDYLKHGGRIGKLAGIAGSMLGIRPLITLKEGEIFPSGIGRGRKRTTEKAIDLLLDYLEENGGRIERFSLCIGFGYDYQEAVEFREHTLERLREKGYSIEKDMLPIYQIGATISVHTGPYPLGFGIIEKGL